MKDFWPRREFRAIFEDFHTIKSNKSKNVSGYGLHEYIDDEKRVKKITKKWLCPIWTNVDFWPNINFAAIF